MFTSFPLSLSDWPGGLEERGIRGGEVKLRKENIKQK